MTRENHHRNDGASNISKPWCLTSLKVTIAYNCVMKGVESRARKDLRLNACKLLRFIASGT